MGKYLDRLPKHTYLQGAITQIKQDYELPDVFYLDMRPFGPSFLMLSSPDAAAIPTTAAVFPQSPLVTDFFEDNIGPSFIEATNGALWKELHHTLAPGLTPGTVRTYHRYLVDEFAGTFFRLLDGLARAGDVVDFHAEAGKPAFGVVMKIIFGEEDAVAVMQTTDFYSVFRELAEVVMVMWRPGDPVTKWRLRRTVHRLVAVLEAMVEERVRARFRDLKDVKVLPNRNTATNMIDRLIVARVASGDPLDEPFLKVIYGK
jgi:cytochrome P450